MAKNTQQMSAKMVTIPLEEFDTMRIHIEDANIKIGKLMNDHCIVVIDQKYDSCRSDIDSGYLFFKVDVKLKDSETEDVFNEINFLYETNLAAEQHKRRVVADKLDRLQKEVENMKNRTLWQRIWNR